MLAYAPRRERRRLHPTALVLIVAVHAAALLAVMSVRMDVTRNDSGPTVVDFIPNQPRPEPAEPRTAESDPAPAPPLSAAEPLVPLPPLPGPSVAPLPANPLPPSPLPGTGADLRPAEPAPLFRAGPRFVTPDADIRPPYPEAKRAREEEAVLRLKLSIDERGRVIAVDPVGKADATFFAAARRHILKAWRYTPAMEGDRAIASSTVITLEFRLD